MHHLLEVIIALAGTSAGAGVMAFLGRGVEKEAYAKLSSGLMEWQKHDVHYPEDIAAVRAVVAAVIARVPRSSDPAEDFAALAVRAVPSLKPFEPQLAQAVGVILTQAKALEEANAQEATAPEAAQTEPSAA